jgi:guanylate kinase
VLGELYGTPMPEPPPGRDIVLEIDVQGAEQVLKRCKDVVCVLLVPPSAADQAQRMEERGDPAAHVRARLELARRELETGRALAVATVVNRDVGQATDELAGILERARRGAS